VAGGLDDPVNDSAMHATGPLSLQEAALFMVVYVDRVIGCVIIIKEWVLCPLYRNRLLEN